MLKIFILILLVLVIFVAFSGTWMSRVEQPEYSVIQTKGEFEIRDYKPMIVAEVKVSGERGAAIRTGFRYLADYIFGNNASNQKMAMTAPVIQAKDKDAWKIRFVLSKKLSEESLPKPTSDEVDLIREPVRRFAVIQFSGIADDSSIEKQTDKLQTYLLQEKLTAIGDPLLALYNPPWTLPFLRRNEVLIEIRAD